MHFRTLLSGTLAALLSCGVAVADSRMINPSTPPAGLPGVFEIQQDRPVILAQSDGGNVALQEEIRRLNGRIEELNFQILQMQEQLRKMQEDNEFRFQELEGGKKSDAGGAKPDTSVAEAPARPAAPTSEDPVAGEIASADAATDRPTPPGDVAAAGQPTEPGSSVLQPKTMGTITFDADGNVVGGHVGDQTVVGSDPNGAVQAPGADNTVVASLPRTDDPDTLYRDSYEFILSAQYATAEAGFTDHIGRFPQDARTADARFWLGEAQLGQRKYREAAETFLAASKAYPKSKKAPDMLLKLGVALVGLNQRDVACATFAEVGKRYPGANSTLQQRVKQEQALAAC